MESIWYAVRCNERRKKIMTSYDICIQCENFNSTIKTCKLCNCFMPVKAALPGTECPIGKWSNKKEEDNGD